MSAPTVVVPGQRITAVDDEHESGAGTYIRNGYICSSLAGIVHNSPSTTEEGKSVIEVRRDAVQSIVPSVESTVIVRVTNVNSRFCKCAIIGVENTLLKDSFRAVIRREDVRATEKDKIEMNRCYRPGDIVLAKVMSLGDAQSYVLTTAENELGVVIATSEAGVKMVPISWCEMQCPKTHSKEFRKVAKVQPEYIKYSDPKT